MPLAEGNYRFYRNVKDFGAVGDGVTDDTEAINRAASVYSHSSSETRCGEKCGSTTTTGAVVYFPVRTFLPFVMDSGLIILFSLAHISSALQ